MPHSVIIACARGWFLGTIGGTSQDVGKHNIFEPRKKTENADNAVMRQNNWRLGPPLSYSAFAIARFLVITIIIYCEYLLCIPVKQLVKSYHGLL